MNFLNRNKGITLISLVVTIVVLLILAGVSIATLTGDNGILTQAGKAKEQTEIASEKEQLQLAMTSMNFESEKDLIRRKTIFQGVLDKSVGNSQTKAYINGNGYIVEFLSSQRLYSIDENGNINIKETKEQVSRDFLEQLEDSSCGSSKSRPYEINSIEDLLDFSYKVNGIEVENNKLIYTNNYKTFENKYVKMLSTLDFKNELCYMNAMRTDYGDINENGIVESLLVELTTEEGWICIGGYGESKNTIGFSGEFDGNNCSINNLCISNNEIKTGGGFFGRIYKSKISNLKIVGDLYGNVQMLGGIAGISEDSQIIRCGFEGKIKNIYNDNYDVGTGGLVGMARGGTEITNSYNLSDIDSENSCIGGITGKGGKITYCYNKGNIIGTVSVGGISGYCANVENSLNTGKITSTLNYAGGIVGQNYAGENYEYKIYKCYNIGSINTYNFFSGGICGGSASTNNFVIEECYNNGEISAKIYASGILGYSSGTNTKILNSYNTGIVKGDWIAGISITSPYVSNAVSIIVSCYNSGLLIGTNIYGITQKGVVQNNYYLSTCGATDTISIPKSQGELKGLANTLDKEFTIDDENNKVIISENSLQNIWIDDTNNIINEGYPIFSWQMQTKN